jgi:ribonuclease HI
MFEVSIFVESTWKGPARRDGVAVWLIEYIRKNGEPETRGGTIRLRDGTQTKGTLLALQEAFATLVKPCQATVWIPCRQILSARQNGWVDDWKANGWKNAKGEPVKHAAQWQALEASQGKHTCTFQMGWHTYQDYLQGQAEKGLEEWQEVSSRTRK